MHARELQRDYWKPIAGNILPEVAHILRLSPTQREGRLMLNCRKVTVIPFSIKRTKDRKRMYEKKGQNNSPIFIKAKGRGKITIT